MNITLLTIGSRGDVQPYIALGYGLQQAGHRVCIGTHQEFESLIRDYGLDFYPVKGNPREVLQSATGQNLMNTGTDILKFLKSFREAAHDSMLDGFDDCLKACQGSDLMLYSFFVMPVGLQISEYLGIPSMAAWLQPFTPTNAFPTFMLPNLFLGGLLNRATHVLAEQLFWHTFKDIIYTWRRNSLQLKTAFHPFSSLQRQRIPILNGYSRHLVPRPSDWPEWAHVTGFWFLDQPQSWQPPAELIAFLNDGPPPVCIGFGSMSDQHAAELTAIAEQALTKSQQRGLFITGWGGLQANLGSDQIYQIEAIPHDWLFPQVGAVVHHAGAGTTAATLRAGVPAITVPFFGDQAFWGYRVFGMGVGPRPIARKALNGERLSQAIRQAVHTPRMRKRVASMGQQIRAEDGVVQTVKLIERYRQRR
jgi:UDP:flavonoid glycosyltransferase YjiC (YdhE family)